MPVPPRSSDRSNQLRPGSADLRGITPLSVSRLSDEVADQIRRLIISEGVAEGARLPSERDLAERFGASRPTVSQALRTLALMGLVETRRGSGAYVLRRPETMVTASVNLMLDLDEESLGHLMQLRLWLETLGVKEAALREPELSPQEQTDIATALDRLGASAGRPSEWIAADTVFHATLVRSSGNPYVAAVYESVHTAILSFEFDNWIESESVPAWLRKSQAKDHMALHQPIADAVVSRDPEAAAEAVLRHHEVMLDHLEAARRTARRRRPSRRR
ncbi:FadR/GntR family transcriptional regulator [Streptomyces fulvoviolaceus]|uniref:FadR/GntR family transcriptional regulator n=1 Tax=Streptomyces fulvoviolaceus TaxID=285535 RepID=UPI0018FE5EF0|nr:FadR/GntR family transcriptional regulator [Streptomyces fulvoviolaceus]